MPVFCIQDFEDVLRIMIKAYDKHSRKSLVPYLGYDVVISFQPADFTRVFDILGTTQGGKKIYSKPRKMDKERKLKLVELVCKDQL